MIAALALGMAMAATRPAAAPVQGFLDLGALRTLCEADVAHDASAASLCLGYVIGAVDQLMARQARRPAQHLRRTICLPRETTAEALHAVVLNDLADQPGRSNTPAAGFIRQALELSFPCDAAPAHRAARDGSEPMR